MPIISTSPGSVRALPAAEISRWQQALRSAVRDPAELCRLLALPEEIIPAAQQAGTQFGLFAPRGYIGRMTPGDPDDPLLRQVLPIGDEMSTEPGFNDDPVGETQARRHPGLLQKYRGRVLMVLTGACAVHCRYCFRRHYPYSDSPPDPQAWETALAEIGADPTIEEVLLSGGDPLTLVDAPLARLVENLAQIPHLRRLRIHTRLPIMIPERVTDQLLHWLTGTRLAPVMVVHANHPAELDEPVSAALARLVDAGVPVLNQAVLLRGVNDNLSALVELSRRLIDRRVMPYYLHQLDRVSGAAHFEVPIEQGRQLVRAMREELPGYAVPRYVQELAGETHKRVLE